MDLFRETVAGQLIYYGSRKKVLYYPEEDPNWIVPSRYTGSIVSDASRQPSRQPSPAQLALPASRASSQQSHSETFYTPREEVDQPLQRTASRLPVIQDGRSGSHSSTETAVLSQKKRGKGTPQGGGHRHHEPTETSRVWEEEVRTADNTPSLPKDPNCVDWYGPDDPDNPRNWSLFKKCFVTFDLCFLTFRYASLHMPRAYPRYLHEFALLHAVSTWVVRSLLRA